MGKGYLIRFCFKKYSIFFITVLVGLFSGSVKSRSYSRIKPFVSSSASDNIVLESIELLSSVNHLSRFDEKEHCPSSERPKKYFFYIHTNVSSSDHTSYPDRFVVSLLIDYEINDGSRKINGSDIGKYIEGDKRMIINILQPYLLNGRKWPIDSYCGIGVKFKDAYYKEGLNKYKLMIRVSEEGNPSKMGTLTIEPMDVRVKLNRMSNGCSDKVSMEAVRASTTTKSGLDLFYSGTGKDDLDGAPQSVDMRDLASNQINIPLKKIYATKSKNLQIVAHARGYTPSCHELNIPAADGLTLSAAVLERNQKTNGERIPVTISIPQCHVNPFYSMPITLTYSNNAQMDLDGSPQSVKIPAGQSQYQFDVFLKSAVRCAKDLTMTASSSDFQNIASSNISLPASNELKLEAMYHGKQKNVYEHISVLVKMIKCSSNSERNTVIRLCYEGAGAAYLLNPPSTLDLSNELKTISIYLDRQRSLCDASLKIFASADDAAIVSQTITLGSPERKTIVLSTVN